RIRVEVFTAVGAPPPQPPARAREEMRTAIERFMLVRPEPDPPQPLRQAVRRVGAAFARVLNGPLTDWRVAGRQLNPMRVGARHLIAARAGLDPAVPYEHLGAVTVLSRGPFAYQTWCFARLAPRGAAAGLFAGQFHDNRTWSDDRALTADMFGFPTIDAFGPGMAAALDEVCAGLDEAIARDPDAVIDLNVMMSKIAYTIILRAVFGDTDLVELHALGAELSHS